MASTIRNGNSRNRDLGDAGGTLGGVGSAGPPSATDQASAFSSTSTVVIVVGLIGTADRPRRPQRRRRLHLDGIRRRGRHSSLSCLGVLGSGLRSFGRGEGGRGFHGGQLGVVDAALLDARLPASEIAQVVELGSADGPA